MLEPTSQSTSMFQANNGIATPRLLARSRNCLLQAGQEPPLGSHIVTPRCGYTHHGIYVGHGRVVQYAGLAHGLRTGPVEEVTERALSSLRRFVN